MTQPNEDQNAARAAAGDDDETTAGHERFAGRPVDDGFGQDGESDPAPVIGRDTGNEIRNQRPEEEEFGLRATQSGDPDEDRPNGDPHTVGHPVGGGERSPDVSSQQDEDRAGTPDERG